MPADQPPRQRVELSADAANTYDIRIARDGTWFHEGAPIGRKALVKLFASVLWRDDGGYWLRTPAEQGRIRSEEHTSELQSLVRISYADCCLKKQKNTTR